MVVFVFVFFFKQKTAYEMRISDWSSDVCSSDLQPRLVVRRQIGRGGMAVQIEQEVDGRAIQLGLIGAVGQQAGIEIVAQILQQIGRAACRERVCQYV